MPQRMRLEEYALKLGLLESTYPGMMAYLQFYDDGGWLIMGYRQETSEAPLIKVEAKSFRDAEFQYAAAYYKLVNAGVLKPPTVEHSQAETKRDAEGGR